MKTPRLLLLVIVVLFAGFTPRMARADDVSFDYFYNALDPYGDWIEVADYGYCWRPDNVPADWAPYTDGYWSYTDAGWTWVSYEDFGSICYHYGRWINLEEEGWCWVPDDQWGPAWVSWRHNDERIGWAPLPPEARFRPEVGISVWADSSYDIGPASYNFCEIRDFGAPVISAVIIPRVRNVTFIVNTINITNICFNHSNRLIFCGGPRYDFIARQVHRQVPTLKIVRNVNVNIVNNTVINNTIINKQSNRSTNPLQRTVQRGNTLEVFAPNIKAPQVGLKPSRITKVVPKEKINKGWANVEPETRTGLRQKLADQTKGKTPETSPANKVEAADLAVIPKKADPDAPVANRPRPRDHSPDGDANRPDRPDGPRVLPRNEPKTPNNNDRPDRPDAPRVLPRNEPRTPNNNNRPDRPDAPRVLPRNEPKAPKNNDRPDNDRPRTLNRQNQVDAQQPRPRTDSADLEQRRQASMAAERAAMAQQRQAQAERAAQLQQRQAQTARPPVRSTPTRPTEQATPTPRKTKNGSEQLDPRLR